MGGHSAWRKRVANGELAKGSGGAILRHRPRLGRKGKDLALNRKGNLGGHGNPKKKTRNKDRPIGSRSRLCAGEPKIQRQLVIWLLVFLLVLLSAFLLTSVRGKAPLSNF